MGGMNYNIEAISFFFIFSSSFFFIFMTMIISTRSRLCHTQTHTTLFFASVFCSLY